MECLHGVVKSDLLHGGVVEKFAVSGCLKLALEILSKYYALCLHAQLMYNFSKPTAVCINLVTFQNKNVDVITMNFRRTTL